MQTYISTFISGFNEVVLETLKSTFSDLKIELELDGSVVYQSAAPVREISNLRFLNNSFWLLADIHKQDDSYQTSVINNFMEQFDSENLPLKLGKPRNFRIVFSKENRAAPLSHPIREQLERKIKQRTRMPVEPLKPDVEFWIIYRKEEYWFFGLRLTNETQTKLQAGELRPQLANLLCLISEPSPDDVILDPFCGYGSIPLERAKKFPYRQILVSDKDSKLIKELQSETKRLKNFSCHSWDVLQLNEVSRDSINKIITDPPWGIYKPKMGTEMVNFYRQMLVEFQRVVKPGGLIVILTGAKLEFESALIIFENKLVLLKRYDILVSGKKAAVYKVRKT